MRNTIALILIVLAGCQTEKPKPQEGPPYINAMQWYIDHGLVYRTNVVTTNEIWILKK